MSRVISLLFLVSFIFIISCKETPKKNHNIKDKKIGFLSEKAMIVSAREEASKIGISILKKGGNAFDAMIATDLALTVSFPYAGNIGGGGFMVYRTADGKKGALDYREKAPLAAYKDMYLDDNKEIIKDKSTLGAMAVGVPGTLAGLFAIHEKLGTLPFSELIQPAIDLANRGVVVTSRQAKRLSHYRYLFKKANKRKIDLDKEWYSGDTIKYPKLAKTLERIKVNGRSEFYGGQTGKDLVIYLQELGGIMTLKDLEIYQVKWRKPIEFSYKNHTVTSMTLPSSGGVCMAQIIKSVEPYNIGQYKHNSEEYIQLLTEAERRAYADRAHYLGDMDFVDVPLDSLIDKNYLKRRMAGFNWAQAGISDKISYGNIQTYESNETTHYSIVDQFGNAVAVTTTLNGAYGSKVYVDKGGYFLNNEMDDFSAKPGTPNMFGLIGAKANAIMPEKRMLSSMSPTIVEKNGDLFMVLGSPGGSTIITSVMQNILNVIEYDMSMQESVSQARFHHQWLPDVIKMEPNGFDSITKQNLIKKGYKIDESNSIVIGKVDAILILPSGKLEGGADPRGDDSAVGF